MPRKSWFTPVVLLTGPLFTSRMINDTLVRGGGGSPVRHVQRGAELLPRPWLQEKKKQLVQEQNRLPLQSSLGPDQELISKVSLSQPFPHSNSRGPCQILSREKRSAHCSGCIWGKVPWPYSGPWRNPFSLPSGFRPGRIPWQVFSRHARWRLLPGFLKPTSKRRVSTTTFFTLWVRNS